MRFWAPLLLLIACGGLPPPETPPVEVAPPGSPRTARASPIVESVQKGIAAHLPEIARVDVRGTANANDAVVLAAIKKHADEELPALVLDALGLSAEAAERRAGKRRGACGYGNPKAHTSTAGLGATVDERYQTSVHVVFSARGALELCDRAMKIDEPWSARRHPSFWSWESSVVAPLVSMSIGIDEITNDRRKSEIATAWRAAWKDILAAPPEKRTKDDAPKGEVFASELLGYYGRFVPLAESDAAGKQLAKLKSPNARAVMLRVVDLAVRGVLPVVVDQAELVDLGKELRALDAIRTMPALLAARAVVERAVVATNAVNERTHALCTVVGPTLSEADTGPTEVATYLMELDAAYALGTPNLDDVTRKFFSELVSVATSH